MICSNCVERPTLPAHGLCRWCSWWLEQHGELPAVEYPTGEFAKSARKPSLEELDSKFPAFTRLS